MRIAIAPNAFRGSMTAFEAATAIEQGLRYSRLRDLDILIMPLADGGDGTLDVLLAKFGGERLTLSVTSPINTPVQAEIGLLADGRTAVIESARASGLELVPQTERNALTATSFGTGELIRAALDRGYKEIVIGVGGSAMTDGGAGCVQALGTKLLDAQGQQIPLGGGSLDRLDRIDVTGLHPAIAGAAITVLCDVTNPLCGTHGAARVFAPQKGASPDDVERLEANLVHYATIVQRDVGIDVRPIPGGGAAGGLAAGLMAFLNAQLKPGADTVIDLLGYDQQLNDVDLLITGEGKLDSQTAGGKAARQMALIAQWHGIPVVALVGKLEVASHALEEMGISAAWSIVPGPCLLDDALANGKVWLMRAATELGNLLALKI